jgi:hypothetical protein
MIEQYNEQYECALALCPILPAFNNPGKTLLRQADISEFFSIRVN